MDSSPQLQHVLKKMAESEPISLPTPSACLAGKCCCYLFSCRHARLYPCILRVFVPYPKSHRSLHEKYLQNTFNSQIPNHKQTTLRPIYPSMLIFLHPITQTFVNDWMYHANNRLLPHPNRHPNSLRLKRSRRRPTPLEESQEHQIHNAQRRNDSG